MCRVVKEHARRLLHGIHRVRTPGSRSFRKGLRLEPLAGGGRVDKAGFTSEADLKPPLPGGHPHHEPGSPRSAVACSSSSAKLKKRPLCRFWKLRFPASSSSRSRLVALLVGIATLVLVAVVASLVYTLYTRSKVDVRKEEIRQDPEAGSWAVEVTFRVTNRNYSPDLVDHSSRVFKSLASEVARAKEVTICQKREGEGENGGDCGMSIFLHIPHTWAISDSF
ncbi:hypothetical protein HPB52_015431 [Rhipicephalus sanguineus]|uniref:Uncharacterized protein n=1 Tax=Rhipicephalus sanguineus TaxID=34632 RepID=A0A9D4Q6V6_RHISA|nr:hypothetical protein HPB52_015431 [Rhipicephalus sanguineus]